MLQCLKQVHCSCSTAGNASYVIGTLAEMDLGKRRIVHICTDKGDQANKILPALTDMLDMTDTETVMNAAGTMGTLVGLCRNHTPFASVWLSSNAAPCMYTVLNCDTFNFDLGGKAESDCVLSLSYKNLKFS